MDWIIFVVIAIVLLLAGIWFLQKFYAKATLNSALVRTGFGDQRVILSGGCVALPIIHQIQRINMSAVAIKVARTGKEALLTADQLRADVEMEFEFQVFSSEEGVAAAAQSLGRRVERGSEGIEEIVRGALVAAMQNAAAKKSLADLHSARSALTEEVRKAIAEQVERLGLSLITASIIRIDQSDLSHFDERNAFDAQGMRRHAELVAEQRRERVRIETETEIAVRESALARHQRQLEIERTEKAASIANQEAIDRLEAETRAKTAQAKSTADLETERARIESEQKVKAAQVANDEELRRCEMSAILGLEEAKIENEAHLTKLRTAEFKNRAAEESARVQVVLAAEEVQARKDLAIAKREHETARARLAKELELSDLQVKSDTETLAAKTKAEADAKEKLAHAELVKAEAEAKARSTMIAAENSMDPALIAMRLEERKLDRLPEIMAQMMKPVEKIDSIKINQIGGMEAGGSANAGAGVDGAFGSAMNQILNMAVRLPVMKQMGEEIGLDFDANLAGRTADYANRLNAKTLPRATKNNRDTTTSKTAGKPQMEDKNDNDKNDRA